MRHLTQSEIEVLLRNGCTSEDWDKITVSENFLPDCCRNVTFIGECRIGDLSGFRSSEHGFHIPNGIRNALIHDCTIGDRVCIENVHECISKYDIGNDVTIKNVNIIAMKGESSFGNGLPVSVLRETGGTEVILCDLLTSHTAYLMAVMATRDSLLRSRLHELFATYAAQRRSGRGKIEDGVRIKHTGSILNARIGAGAVIEGATYVEECSVNSRPDAPVYIGHNVMAKEFIASSGSSMSGGATIQRCFIGQSTRIDHLYSAHDSLFFANCQLENGESCAVFAGPYTVSMHKSSLLIAGHVSFLNAGSGSNQSNHLYKLGPIHQGVIERGSKTTSDSYILWPSRIGPFSLIMGRHVHHVDTSDFPFSYVIENNDETYLVPGANLRSVGTIRDAKKWPARDRREQEGRLDCINFNLLSPYTISKMVNGHRKLSELRSYIGEHGKTYIYRNINIRSAALEKGLEAYRMGIVKFIGNSLIQRLQERIPKSGAEVDEVLKPDHDTGLGEWVDLCGLIAPQRLVQEILENTRSGLYKTPTDLNKAFEHLHASYYDLEWDWSYNLLREWYGLSEKKVLTVPFLINVLEEWMQAVLSLDRMLYADACKEYNIASRIYFSSAPEAERGENSVENNPFVQEVLDHIRRKEALGNETIQLLKSL